jgi:hypothetical protein
VLAHERQIELLPPAHVVHITFEVVRVGGTLGAIEAGKDTRPIRGVEFVKLPELAGLGFWVVALPGGLRS